MQEMKEPSFMYTLFQESYVPMLMNKFVRPLVILVFTAWLCASIAVIPKIDIGLDVELTMTDDSYVLKYFKVGVIIIRLYCVLHKIINVCQYIIIINSL
jgi:Niemann-Pick C1 protein